MSWVKLDDQWMDHPKIIKAGRDARDMWLASITWCAKHLTDGYFPAELLPSLAVSAGVDVAKCQQFANTLLEVGLWDASGLLYRVHDYLDYNPSKEQAEITKTARKEAGRRGGEAKASKMPSKMLANDVAKSYQKSAPSPSPINNNGNQPEPEPAAEQDEQQSDLSRLSAFVANLCHVPEYKGGVDAWFAGLRELKELGASEAQIEAGYLALKSGPKRYTIVGPQSLVTAVSNVMQDADSGKSPKSKSRLHPDLLASI